MCTRLFALWGATLLAVALSCGGESQSQEQDNTILSLLLQHSYDDGGFTVVAPDTSLSNLESPGQAQVAQAKKFIKEKLKVEGYDIGPLVELLFQRNKERVRLTLQSAPRKGYLVDYEKRYNKYFEKEGGGWEKWYKENPKTHGWTEVSLPAYDEKNQIVIVCIGVQAHWEMGVGYIRAFRYKDAKLEPIGQLMLWVS
jgi:hypothetical protein